MPLHCGSRRRGPWAGPVDGSATGRCMRCVQVANNVIHNMCTTDGVRARQRKPGRLPTMKSLRKHNRGGQVGQGGGWPIRAKYGRGGAARAPPRVRAGRGRAVALGREVDPSPQGRSGAGGTVVDYRACPVRQWRRRRARARGEEGRKAANCVAAGAGQGRRPLAGCYRKGVAILHAEVGAAVLDRKP